MQEPAFDHDNQNSFLDLEYLLTYLLMELSASWEAAKCAANSEYTTKKLNFAIKNLRVQLRPGRDGIAYIIIRKFPN
jgi:hypothetical protein